ncbi:MAG TPA: histidine kinase [Anaeromyxobacteraceae bacterium]|nr:histidine kinase [Anaeromyxobacteraceae bacterium]
MHVALVALALVLAAPQAARPRQGGMPVGKGTERPVVRLTAPSGGWSVGRMLSVEGTVSDPTVDPITLSINGDRYLLRTQGGRFSRKFPAAAGKNVVVATATNQGGTAEAQVTCYAQIPPVPLKVVLTSDTDGVYTDLHVYEPTEASVGPDGKLVLEKMAHVYWANTASPSGGTFYLNEQGGSFDQPGYGPYLYVHRAPPKGVFLVATNYWPSGDMAHTVGTLNLTLFEGTPSETKRLVQVPLATPGTTRVLAWVNVLGDGRADVFVPGQDAPGAGWPANLDEVARQLSKKGGGADYGEL